MSYFDLLRPEYLIVHHTAEDVKGPALINWPSDRVRSYYSGVGFDRGYRNYGYNKKTGYSPGFYKKDKDGKKIWVELNLTCPLTDPVTGYHVYPMYHVSFRKFKEAPFGWVGTPLIRDPLKYNVNSLSGDFPEINKRAISIHFCGNYETTDIENNALLTAAITLYNFYHEFKPQIKGHKDFDKTGCPGKIYDKLNVLHEFFESETVHKIASMSNQIIKI